MSKLDELAVALNKAKEELLPTKEQVERIEAIVQEFERNRIDSYVERELSIAMLEDVVADLKALEKIITLARAFAKE